MSSKIIIVNEKPSVSRDFAHALGVKETTRHDGYIEGYSDFFGSTVQITWCIGHLVTMALPDEYDESMKSWKMETLPFIPEQFKYKIIPDVKKQFHVIKKLYQTLNPGDTLYFAGDSAREGLYIQMLVRQEAGVPKGVEEKVVWIDSQTEEEIKKGIRNALPLRDKRYIHLAHSGYARAKEDYLTGINFTRLLTVKYGDNLNNLMGLYGKDRKSVSVGRVMTCVLGMVVSREREIENFTVTPFYKIGSRIGNGNAEIDAEWKAVEGSAYFESPKLYNENGFLEESEADAFISTLPSSVRIEDVTVKKESKSAPYLFNLSELQFECSRRFKISPDETLQIAQNLYEKKLTTYPRTSARVLSTAVAKVIDKNISGLKKYTPDISAVCDRILSGNCRAVANSRYTDDSKVTDHYAVIPTGEGFSALGSLSDQEKSVYDLIVRRFLSIFLPAAQYEKVSVTEICGQEKFFASGKSLVSPGFYAVYGLPEEKESKKETIEAMKQLQKGKSYSASFFKSKGETTPPKRYNTGSLILAMEHAGQMIDDDDLRAQIKDSGIGTEATRAETIKKLQNLTYITVNKKTQIVTPDRLGNAVYDIVKESLPELLSPRMTASWEKGLEAVKDGNITQDQFLEKLYAYIIKSTSKIKESAGEDISKGLEHYRAPAAKKELDIMCPKCGKPMRKSDKGYGCTGYKKDDPNSCRFFVGKIQNKMLTEAQLSKLLKNGETGVINGFKSKNGNTYGAVVVIGEKGFLEFKKDSFVWPKKK